METLSCRFKLSRPQVPRCGERVGYVRGGEVVSLGEAGVEEEVIVVLYGPELFSTQDREEGRSRSS